MVCLLLCLLDPAAVREGRVEAVPLPPEGVHPSLVMEHMQWGGCLSFLLAHSWLDRTL